MSTKREEEKNEKIIRGLLKLPPNRRCINCNSLGPQYVCTDFWTFVCIACSGIHREFTHRVKSVSMAKFTKQEVEALQSGGNQRARELFLKEWDIQQRRLPDSSNADRIREFIKDVYVNKKYSGKKSSNNPPADVEDPMNHDDFRRASSYHSFSQSPPYDYQYEDRRYGKQFGMLTRQPGSDRSQYLAKTTSVIYSPGRRHGQMYEDRIAHESSGSRMSDFSVSSAGDQFRNYAHSPNSQDAGYGSPRAHQSKDIAVEDVRSQFPNRRTAISASSSSVASNALGQDIFKLHTTQQPKVASPPLDLFSGLNNEPSSTSLFERKSSETSFEQPSINLFEEKPSSVSVPKNEGWATFDIPKHSSSDVAANTRTSIPVLPANQAPKGSMGGLLPKKLDIDATINTGTSATVVPSNMPPVGVVGGVTQNNSELFAAQIAGPGGTSYVMHDQRQVDIVENNKLVQQDIAELWNAFDISSVIASHAPAVSQPHSKLLQLPVSEPTFHEQYNFPKDAFKISMINTATGGSELSFDAVIGGPSISAPFQSSLGVFTPTQKYTNPFDVPYDLDLATTSSLSNMGPLQEALPNPQPHSDYFAGLSQPWFLQNSMQTFHPSAEGQVNLQYMPGQGPNPPLPNLHPQGQNASFGGNPFA